MPKKINLCKRVFDTLHNSVKKEFERLAALGKGVPSGKGAAYYGFGSVDDTKPNLMKSLLGAREKAELQAYVEQERYQNISRKHLYNLSRSFASLDLYDTFEVDLIFLNILAKYITYEDFDHFLNTHPSIREKTREIQTKVRDLSEGQLSESELATHYMGFYYSFLEGKRKSLRLWVNYYNKSNNQYPAKLLGLHSGMGESDEESNIYLGHAREMLTCFYLYLEEGKKQRPINIMGYKGHLPARDLQFMRTILMGISEFGYPFSLELFLFRLNDEQKLLDNVQLIDQLEGLQYVDFYLLAQRRNFRVPPRIINRLEEVKALGTSASMMKNIPGQYRIWTLGFRGDLIQSKFTIHDNFSAELGTIGNNSAYQKQTCVFSVSNVEGRKLCVSAHANIGVSVINYAIFDLDINNQYAIEEGVYCGIGVVGETKFAAESLVIFKDSGSFEPKRIKPTDVKKVFDQDPSLREKLLSSLLSQRKMNQRHHYLKRIHKLRDIILGVEK